MIRIRKALAITLSVLMVLSVVPNSLPVYAAEADTSIEETQDQAEEEVVGEEGSETSEVGIPTNEETTEAVTEEITEKVTEETTEAVVVEETTEATTEETTAAKSTTEAATEAATEATTEDLSDTSSNLAKPTDPAYASDGSTVYLTLQEDETWTTDSGAVYYEGTDGVLRSRGNPDLTFKSPDEQ